MRRFFGRKENDNIIIEGSEFIHMKKVLRMSEGDKFIASVNDEYDYYATIEKINKENLIASIEKKEKCPALPKNNLVLFQMMPKKEYFDSILPKAIELGVNEIYFFSSSYTMVKDFKRERVNQQVLSACKQCERSLLVPVHDVIKFNQMLEMIKEFDVILFPNEHEKSIKFDTNLVKNKKNIAVVIGNEAGFSEDEASLIIKNGAKSFTLGRRILRCDTAVVATLTLASLFSEN